MFRDPKNTFKVRAEPAELVLLLLCAMSACLCLVQGLKNYQTICWSLRFHGSLFFRDLRCEVQRLWQLEETVLRCAMSP